MAVVTGVHCEHPTGFLVVSSVRGTYHDIVSIIVPFLLLILRIDLINTNLLLIYTCSIYNIMITSVTEYAYY